MSARNGFFAETVTIATLGHGGDGIADTPEGRVFVSFALPGEVVSFERNGDRGTLLRVDRASPDRVTPFSRHFGSCGGCSLQHYADAPYLDWKRQLVVAAFAQRGIAAPVEPTVAIGRGARRRAAFTAIGVRGGASLGFNRRGTNEVLPLSECPILVPAISDRLGLLGAIAGAVLQPGQRGRVHVLAADNGLDVAIERGRKAAADRPLLQKLARLGSEPAVARLSLEGEPVVLNRRPELVADGSHLFPPPAGFVQASARAEAAMSDIVIAAAAGSKGPVADLFAGVGTFSLRLARRTPVTAVEGDAGALAALQHASNQATGLKAITTLRHDLFRVPLRPPELRPFGAVVFDPPRAGAKAQAEQIAASTVPVVVAVSCNPATLARDARILVDGGYGLTRVVPIDQFAYSAEVEAVAVFER